MTKGTRKKLHQITGRAEVCYIKSQGIPPPRLCHSVRSLGISWLVPITAQLYPEDQTSREAATDGSRCLVSSTLLTLSLSLLLGSTETSFEGITLG